MIPFVLSSGIGKINLLGRKSEHRFPLETWEEGLPKKGWERNCWYNGHFLYLNGGLGYTGVCFCQNSSNGALRIYAFHAMQILFQKKE